MEQGGRAPRVSVCIPTADRPAFLRESVASVEAQTFRDLELVVSDNSRDPSNRTENERIVAGVSGIRTVYRPQPVPVDVIVNFNTVIDLAGGELWMVMGDDDRLRPPTIARAVEALDRHPECGFTFADHFLINADGSVDPIGTEHNSRHFGRDRLREGVYRHDELFPLALEQALCLQTMLFRKPLIERFRFIENILMCDFSLELRIATDDSPTSGYYIPDRNLEYRIHPAQASAVTGEYRRRLAHGNVAALETIPRATVPAAHRASFDRRLSRDLSGLAMAECDEGAEGAGRASARRAFAVAVTPFSIGAMAVTHLPFALRTVRLVQAALRAARRHAQAVVDAR
jgi:glycosyltransferase involved in cell wall biosynthesis